MLSKVLNALIGALENAAKKLKTATDGKKTHGFIMALGTLAAFAGADVDPSALAASVDTAMQELQKLLNSLTFLVVLLQGGAHWAREDGKNREK